MSYGLTLLGIGTVHLLVAISPGPAFLTVTRVSVGATRRAALAAGWGVASASVVWALAASLGMQVLLTEAAWLSDLMKLAGGAYLIWLGIQSWRHAGAPLAMTVNGAGGLGIWRAWRLGFATNLANPKAIVFFGSIFVTLFAVDTPLWVRVAALAIVAVNESVWYSLVALAFSSRPVQSAYRRGKRWIERVLGTAMLLFGLRLIADVRA